MKFYLIPPNKHLTFMNQGNAGYFCLAHHYVNDKQYREYFLTLRQHLNPNGFITLDNGSAEHSLVTEDILLDIVGELRPSEVIAPDVLFDMIQTVTNLQTFASKMDSRGYTKHTTILGCPQGSTKEEWLGCYEHMLNNPYVSAIGMSKIAIPKCWNNATGDTMIAKSRQQCIKHLKDNYLLRKPLHLLGMGEFTEYLYYYGIPYIRSSDSCYAMLAAMNGISFKEGNTSRVPTDNSYFDAELSPEVLQLGISNISLLQRIYKDI